MSKTKSKKVLLISLPAEGKCEDWRAPDYYKTTKSAKYMPLGLLSLATNLQEHHEVIILDVSARGLSIEETISEIENQKPDVLGISSLTERVYAMREILQKTSAPYEVVGGPHVTYYADLTLRQGADAVFVGQLADLEFREAVETMPKGIIKCQTKLNQIQIPKRELIDYNFYIPKEYVFFKAENRLPMFSSIGCPFHCTFCDVQSKRIQRRSPSLILDEMEYLYSLGSRSIHFLDDNFNVNEKHLHRVIDEMDKRGFDCEWSGRGRAKMTPDLAKRLAEHKFKRIHVGLEALDDTILKFYKKPQTMKQITEFCNTTNRYGIDVLGYFIIGSPLDTEPYLQSLPDKINELGIKYPYVQILYPAPNTEYYQQLLDQGVYKKDLWEEFMQDPVPNYALPYPYEKSRLDFLLAYQDELEKQFMVAH